MKKINNKVVVGEGFKIEVLNQFVLNYCEGEKVIELGLMDTMSGKDNITVIPFFKPRWGSDYSVDFLNDEEKDIVKNRISKALTLLKIRHKFDTNEGPRI
ncbi:hypothetical protein [Flexithrix dorotheae]|uniref:hypothetical protein n=1 Tax=Flexithrix dorotheae TaxID=70993 RepID=UPI00035CC924|nr:hypothetical protein [Flexithrix dorotheae]